MADPASLDPEAAQSAIEHCYGRDWTDGLPVVPATRELVDRFLSHTRRAPDEVIGRMEHLGRQVTVELAAINAAMAGCLPEYFPVLLGAWDALMLERAASGGGWQSTSGPAPMIVVNGPVRERLGFNSGGGAFGPGFRPNATIARAIGLIVRNAFGIRPHLLEQATQGLPGRWSICFGENEEESPWEPLANVGGLEAGADGVSATLLRTCEFVDNRHTHDAEQLLWDFADTIARPGSLIFRDTAVGVIFCPEHAQMLAEAGFSRSGVQRWLIEHAGRSQADLWRAGKGLVENRVRSAGGTAPGEEGADELVRVLPDDVRAVLVAVAGARNAGISMVVRQFGLWSGRSVPIETEAAAGGTAPATDEGESSLAPTRGDGNDQ